MMGIPKRKPTKATVEEAIEEIKQGDWDYGFACKRRNKKRICIRCLREIPPGIDYYKHFEYPYIPGQKRWVMCEDCFTTIVCMLEGRTWSVIMEGKPF